MLQTDRPELAGAGGLSRGGLAARFLLSSLLLLGSQDIASGAAASAADPAPAPWVEDAALHDLACPDPQYAWAVGDQGAIWHTDDGGAHWRQQASGVRCSLQGVWFVNRQIGWAVGGQWQPYCAATGAVVLRTDDGGHSWHSLPTLMPALCQVQFFDSRHGLAWGHGSGNKPSGLFATDDGGHHWRALGDGPQRLWLGGHFVAGLATEPAKAGSRQPATVPDGVVVGPAGRAAQLVGGEYQPLRGDPFANRPLRDVRLLPPTSGWLVGDGGLVLGTSDLGHSWQTVPSLVPGQLGQRDFHTVAVRDRQVWLAGSPGTHILYSADGGQTWQQQPTGSQAPIQRVRFASARQGWAVGSLGTILASHDSGRTWQIQHQGGQRVALLGLFATAHDLPLLTLAKLSREEGYRVAVRILFEPQNDPARPDLNLETRLHASLGSLYVDSATAAWQFSLPSDRLQLTPLELAKELNRRHDGQAAQHLVADLVRRIRLWRPEAVLIPGAKPDREPQRPLDTILRQAVLAAVEQAADPTQQIDQITRLGLAPWRVQRVLGWIPGGGLHQRASATGENRLRVTAEEIAYHSGQTLGNLTRVARGLLAGSRSGWNAPLTAREQQAARNRDQPAWDPQAESAETFVVLANRHGAAVGGNLLSGLNLAPGGAARRRPAALTGALLADGGFGKLRRQAQRQRNLRRLLQAPSGDLSPEAQRTQVARQADTLNRTAGAALLEELAWQYRAEGQLDRTADMLQRLLRHAPKDPLAGSALQWLVAYYASGETAHIMRHVQASPVRQASASGPEAQAAASSAGRPAANAGVVASSFTGNLAPEDRLAMAVQLAKLVTTPTLAADPTIRWPLAVAQRKRGFTKNAKRTMLILSHRAADNPWQACAQAEAWLARPGQDPPRKPIATCRRAEQPPHLDGRLDEALWQAARPLRLTGGQWESAARKGKGEMEKVESGERRLAGKEAGTELKERQANVRIAYDAAYLYLAIRCAKVVGVDYSGDDRPRPRDGDLSAHDRIRLLLDIDRDYRSYYELTIDARGWTAESCYGNTHWNPQWFVASGGDRHTWTAEAAIPLGELVGDPVRPRHVWAVAIDRVVPEAGLQTWVGPTFDQPGPENFGLLIFE